MTPEAQRIAIAEACGLKPVVCPFIPNRHRTGHDGDWFTPEAAEQMRQTYPSCACPKIIPDYLNDLNAMYEAESTLKPEQVWDYCNQLNLLTGAFKQDPEFCAFEWESVHATAAQRAEAFLRTIGKWTDD